MWKYIATILWCIKLGLQSEAAVLDPALYLLPSPPLKPVDGVPQGDFWAQSRIERDADLTVLPIEDEKTTTIEPLPEPQETMDRSETFWPFVARYRTAIHVPVTYSLTGSYGQGIGAPSSGVIGSSYVSVTQDGAVNQYGTSGLAGSSYGRYGTRVFGGSSGPAWSGWGNGKWGHYGKGK